LDKFGLWHWSEISGQTFFDWIDTAGCGGWTTNKGMFAINFFPMFFELQTVAQIETGF
jgi:hypothetical protein